MGWGRTTMIESSVREVTFEDIFPVMGADIANVITVNDRDVKSQDIPALFLISETRRRGDDWQAQTCRDGAPMKAAAASRRTDGT